MLSSWPLAIRPCTVNFKDARGVEHSTEVLVETVMEVAALGLRCFRGAGNARRRRRLRYASGGDQQDRARCALLKLNAWLESAFGGPEDESDQGESALRAADSNRAQKRANERRGV